MTVPAIEAEAQPIVDDWVDRVAELLTAETARLTLRNHIREMLRQGTIPTMQVIAAARAGHADADLALRQLGVEMLDAGVMPDAALRAYLLEALIQPPVTYPPGRNLADTWMRDVGIALLVRLTAARFGVRPSRNPAATGASAAALVSRALVRRGHNTNGPHS